MRGSLPANYLHILSKRLATFVDKSGLIVNSTIIAVQGESRAACSMEDIGVGYQRTGIRSIAGSGYSEIARDVGSGNYFELSPLRHCCDRERLSATNILYRHVLVSTSGTNIEKKSQSLRNIIS